MNRDVLISQQPKYSADSVERSFEEAGYYLREGLILASLRIGGILLAEDVGTRVGNDSYPDVAILPELKEKYPGLLDDMITYAEQLQEKDHAAVTALIDQQIHNSRSLKGLVVRSGNLDREKLLKSVRTVRANRLMARLENPVAAS